MYALSNPLLWRDPSGLSPELVGMVLGASTSVTTPSSLLDSSSLPPDPLPPTAWQYYEQDGVRYRARQIKNWPDLNKAQKFELLWNMGIDIVTLKPDEPNKGDFLPVLQFPDPRFEVDPNSFVPVPMYLSPPGTFPKG